MRIVDLKTKKGIFKPVHPSLGAQVDYYRQLKFIIQQINKRFNNTVIEQMNREFIKKKVQDDDFADRLDRIIKEFRKKINTQFSDKRIVLLAEKMVNSLFKYNQIRWTKELAKFGIDIKRDADYSLLKSFLKASLKSNVTTIKNLKETSASSLEKMIYTGFEKGYTFSELGKQLSDRLRIDKTRAVRIAKEETKNLNTQLNKRRMVEYGIEEAIWITAGDRRVRGNPAGPYANTKSNHYKFDGKKYVVGKGLWNAGIGQWVEPGEEFGCRCVASPIL